MIANYHSIDTFSNVDGPGIRYVLFLQGCNTLCKYCHNIDVAQNVKRNAITVDEVVEDFLKYQRFYLNGGITISGGEALMQIDFVVSLFKKMKELKIHTCLETQGSLFVNNEKYHELIKVTDLFIVDLKGVNAKLAKLVSDIDIERSYQFLNFLNEMQKEFLITYVLIPTLNDSDECFDKLGLILSKFDPSLMSFKILPYHRLGINKWHQLNLIYQLENIREPSNRAILNAKALIQKAYQKYLNEKN